MCIYDHFMGSLLNKHRRKGTQYISIENLVGIVLELDLIMCVIVLEVSHN